MIPSKQKNKDKQNKEKQNKEKYNRQNKESRQNKENNDKQNRQNKEDKQNIYVGNGSNLCRQREGRNDLMKINKKVNRDVDKIRLLDSGGDGCRNKKML